METVCQVGLSEKNHSSGRRTCLWVTSQGFSVACLRRQGGLKCPVRAISVGIRVVPKFSGTWPQADKGKGVLGQRIQFHEGDDWAFRL